MTSLFADAIFDYDITNLIKHTNIDLNLQDVDFIKNGFLLYGISTKNITYTQYELDRLSLKIYFGVMVFRYKYYYRPDDYDDPPIHYQLRDHRISEC